MSELKVDKVSPRTGNYVALNTVGSKNIVINGDMSIAQRGTSVSSISSGSAYNTIDRMRFGVNGLGTWTQSQDTDVPSGQGFAKSFKLDCTATGTLGASDYLFLNYNIEGQMLQYIKKGTANAESLTLSFWVKSNKTGTYTFELDDNDNGRSISKTYTVDSADTWEKKTITIEGDTTGTLDNDNNNSLRFYFWLGAGSNYTSGTLQSTWQSTTDANRVSSSQVNLADNTANDWYITGVQLEAGTTASDFEFLPYDVNLNRCLRYFAKFEAGSGENYALGITNNDDLNSTTTIPFSVRMRIAPTSITQTGTASDYRIRTVTSDTCTGVPTLNSSTENNVEVNFVNSGHGFGSGVIIKAQGNSSSSFIGVNAEL